MSDLFNPIHGTAVVYLVLPQLNSNFLSFILISWHTLRINEFNGKKIKLLITAWYYTEKPNPMAIPWPDLTLVSKPLFVTYIYYSMSFCESVKIIGSLNGEKFSQLLNYWWDRTSVPSGVLLPVFLNVSHSLFHWSEPNKLVVIQDIYKTVKHFGL